MGIYRRGRHLKTGMEDKQMNRITFGFLAALALSVPATASSGDDNWKDGMEAALKQGVQLTKLGSHGSISTVGSKFTLKVENIQAMPTDGFLPNANVIDNGVRKDANLGTRALTGLLNASTRKTQGNQIDAGSSVGIMRFSLEKKSVIVEVVTLKQSKITLKGDTQSEYLYTNLQFPFADLSTMEPAAVREVIWQTLVPENASLLTSVRPAEASAKPTESTSPNVAAKPAGVSRISVLGSEPSGAEPARNSGNNSLIGKEVIDLIDKLGAPDEKLEAGSATIYIYKDLGLKFKIQDGKVVSAQ